MFPVEIWEEIFKHADPVDLLRLRRVCKSWNAIVLNILQRADIWYKKCSRDVPRCLWSSILEHQNHPSVNWQDLESARKHVDVWCSLFRSWMHWRRLTEKAYNVETRRPIPYHRPYEIYFTDVTLFLQGNIIAVGRSEGYLTFYDIKDNRVFHVDQAIFIQDLQLWRNGADEIIATSSCINDRVNHWNVQKGFTEGHSRGTLISASFEYCYTIIDDEMRVERPFTLQSENGGHNESVNLIEARYALPKIGKIMAVAADGQEVMLWTATNSLYRAHTDLRDCRLERDDFEMNEPGIFVRHYKIFKPCVLGCIGELGEFGLSIGGRKWRIYNMLEMFYAPVTAILFHVSLLVLGLNSGDVHMFAIPDVNHLDSLDLETIPSTKIPLDTDAIISLNAMEHNSTHYIVAATDRQLHIVKFNAA